MIKALLYKYCISLMNTRKTYVWMLISLIAAPLMVRLANAMGTTSVMILFGREFVILFAIVLVLVVFFFEFYSHFLT